MSPKQVYDQINQESGGVFESPSQGQELRDTQQVLQKLDNRFLLPQPAITKQRWSTSGIPWPFTNPFSKGRIHIFKILVKNVLFPTKIRNFNAIGTDQDIAIYRGFSTQIPDLRLLLCPYHLQKSKRAIYGSGPYRLSTQYVKFLMDSVKWHSLDAEKRRKHVSLFRQHMPTMEQKFKKPQKKKRKKSK